MGRVPKSSAEDRLRVDGQPALPRSNCSNYKSIRVPASLYHRPWERYSGQRNNTVHDITAQG